MINLHSCISRGEHSFDDGAAYVDCPVTEREYTVLAGPPMPEASAKEGTTHHPRHDHEGNVRHFTDDDLPIVKRVIADMNGEIISESDSEIHFKAAPMNATEEGRYRNQLQEEVGRTSMELRRKPHFAKDPKSLEEHSERMEKLAGVRELYRLATYVHSMPMPKADL